MRKILAVLAAMLFAISAPLAMAAPVPYVTGVFDTPNATVNTLVTSLNSSTGMPSAQYLATGSGTTAITVNGLRFTASTTGLTTAAGVTSATITVTNSSIAAASQVFCQANGYAGTGNPQPVNLVPGAGSMTYAIQNTHASAALNATVPITCIVYN